MSTTSGSRRHCILAVSLLMAVAACKSEKKGGASGTDAGSYFRDAASKDAASKDAGHAFDAGIKDASVQQGCTLVGNGCSAGCSPFEGYPYEPVRNCFGDGVVFRCIASDKLDSSLLGSECFKRAGVRYRFSNGASPSGSSWTPCTGTEIDPVISNDTPFCASIADAGHDGG